MTDTVAERDAGVMETTPWERDQWRFGHNPFTHEDRERLLRDFNRMVALALSERQRGREEMRDRAEADLSAHIAKHEAGLRLNPFDRSLIEERVLALDAARSRIRSLSTED